MQLFMASGSKAPEANCTVDLLDSQGSVTDTKVLRFSVNATSVDDIAVSDGTREALSQGDSNAPRACASKCGMFNIVCLWWRGCTRELGLLGGGTAALLIACATPAACMHACRLHGSCSSPCVYLASCMPVGQCPHGKLQAGAGQRKGGQLWAHHAQQHKHAEGKLK
jgi:hypothetical protein